jgi:signal transduction histidine kinase
MEGDLRILLLEDVAEEALLIERVIKKGKLKYSFRRVDSREQFTKSLHEYQPHLILSDHALPQFNSIEALKLAREFDEIVPFILVTGTVSEEFAVACLKQGANDYVLKSNLSRLPSSINQALSQREAQEQKRVAENKLMQQNEKLLASNAELLKINKELDNFVYSVSHNLRGPLSSILGIVNLSRIEQEPNYTWLMEKVEVSVQKLDQTLREILEYSRNSRNDIEYEKIDLKKIVGENFQKLKYIPGSERHQLIITQEGNAAVMTDSYRINIIINNILANSLKYCDPGKTQMIVHVHALVTDEELLISFEDNGIGIASDVLPRMFDMFFRGNEKSEGAGLGLYIVKEAVEKLKGKIEVKTSVGAGTIITVRLPNHEIHTLADARR